MVGVFCQTASDIHGSGFGPPVRPKRPPHRHRSPRLRLNWQAAGIWAAFLLVSLLQNTTFFLENTKGTGSLKKVRNKRSEGGPAFRRSRRRQQRHGQLERRSNPGSFGVTVKPPRPLLGCSAAFFSYLGYRSNWGLVPLPSL